MCNYCVEHGFGKKWYLNARNYSKALAQSEKSHQFCDAFFGRTDVKPGFGAFVPGGPVTEEERRKEDFRYSEFLHHQVVSTDEARSILTLASQQTNESDRAVVLLPCICRYSTYGKDPSRSCYGIAFTDEYTRRFPKYCGGGHNYLSAEQAQEALDQLLEAEPIVHAICALGVPYLGMLCNCDLAVCRPYLLRKRLEIISPFYKAHHRAQVDISKCSGCGICQEVCPFQVAKLVAETNSASINFDACFGCGTCQRFCPESAIRLVPVNQHTPF